MLLRIALGLIGIALIAYALIRTGVLQGGPCGTGPGWTALGVVIICLPLGGLLLIAEMIRRIWKRWNANSAVVDHR